MSSNAAYLAAYEGHFNKMIMLLSVDPAQAQYVDPGSKDTLLHEAILTLTEWMSGCVNE